VVPFRFGPVCAAGPCRDCGTCPVGEVPGHRVCIGFVTLHRKAPPDQDEAFVYFKRVFEFLSEHVWMVVVFGQIACQFCCSRSLIFVVFVYPIIHCFANGFGNGLGWGHLVQDDFKLGVPLRWFWVVGRVVPIVVHKKPLRRYVEQHLKDLVGMGLPKV